MADVVFRSNVDDFLKKFRAGEAAGLKTVAENLRREYRRTLGKPGRGRPSSPGEPPRRQTGTLRDAIKVRTNRRRREASILILKRRNPNSDATANKYGVFLDQGTKHIRPRPWIIPGWKRAKRRHRTTFVRVMRAIFGR